MSTLPASLLSSTAINRRSTRPEYYNPYRSGGLGAVPRRGFDQCTRTFIEDVAANPDRGIRDWAGTAPLRLLDVLVRIHPLAQMALSNDCALAFLPGATSIVAVEREEDKQTNSEGTAVLNALWESIPSDLGGLTGLQYTLAHQASVYGMGCLEAVTQKGAGVLDIPDFSPVSVRWSDTDKGRALEQLQGSEWKVIPANGPDATVFAIPYRGSRENPYGIPRFAAFLSEGLTDISEQRNLADVMRAIAFPHLWYEFPVDNTVKFAMENPDVLVTKEGSITPLEYANRVHTLFMERLATLLADDQISLPTGARVNVLNAGQGLAGAISAMEMRRLRVCQSLDHLPSLLGITDGGTLAYSSTQWKQYASKLEAVRGFANSFLVRIANLHLRALGINLIARADTEPIQTSDRLNEAQARALEIANENTLVKWGYRDPEDASVILTGSEMADPARFAETVKQAAAGKDSQSGNSIAQQNDPANPTPAGQGKQSK